MGANCSFPNLQEAGWTEYPTFNELHQILYRSEVNIYENFALPPGITAGELGSHVNEKTIDMLKKLLDRPPRFIIEVTGCTPYGALLGKRHLLKLQNHQSWHDAQG